MIDVKLKNGDTALDEAGRSEMISGSDAQFQRAVICMTVPKGSFVYDRGLGAAACEENDAKKELVMNEALAAFENTSVTGVCGETVEIDINGEKKSEEVHFYGEI